MPNSDLILLALDDTPFLQLGKRALQAAGYETVEARDQEGVERVLRTATPSLLLVGEHFNGQSGIDLSIAQLERFPTLPILIYAEKDTVNIAKQVLRAGISGYICPPLRTEDISNAVRRSLAHARQIGDWVRHEVKRTTASLQRQVHDFDSIFNSIGDGILIISKRGRVAMLNETMTHTFGLIPESVIGKPVEEVLPHPDILALLNRPNTDNLKYHEVNFKDGRVFNAQHTQIPGIGSAITLQDITYLKEFERIKTDFVHTVSHDLRSPLTSVMGYAELIGRAGPLTAEQQDFLARLKISVNAVTTLVNDLLDLGRLEAGFDTRREIVQIENIVTYTLDILSQQIRSKNLVIEVDQSPGLPPLKANPLRLRQMLDNLISNAIKYTPEGGEICVSVRPEGDQVIVSVSDTGPGIPVADQPHIFEKFYRASNVPDGVTGSGLGLAIVKSIVDSHQGRVWVESALDKGSTFFVVLPAYAPSAP